MELVSLSKREENFIMTPENLKRKIEGLAPETKTEIQDLTGTQNHYQALIISLPYLMGSQRYRDTDLLTNFFPKSSVPVKYMP